MDFRPDGAYRYAMRSPQGRDYWARGVYRDIVVPERIVFTATVDDEPWHEILTTVTFADRDGKTQVTVQQRFVDTAMTRGTRDGLTQTLDRLTEYLAGMGG